MSFYVIVIKHILSLSLVISVCFCAFAYHKGQKKFPLPPALPSACGILCHLCASRHFSCLLFTYTSISFLSLTLAQFSTCKQFEREAEGRSLSRPFCPEFPSINLVLKDLRKLELREAFSYMLLLGPLSHLLLFVSPIKHLLDLGLLYLTFCLGK